MGYHTLLDGYLGIRFLATVTDTISRFYPSYLRPASSLPQPQCKYIQEP